MWQNWILKALVIPFYPLFVQKHLCNKMFGVFSSH